MTGKFIAVGDSLAISADGATWVVQTNTGHPNDELWQTVAASPDGTKTIAFSIGYWAKTTNSGASWTRGSVPWSGILNTSYEEVRVVWFEAMGRFVALVAKGFYTGDAWEYSSVLKTSANLSAWDEILVPFGVSDIVCDAGMVVAMSDADETIYTSTDLLAWSAPITPISNKYPRTMIRTSDSWVAQGSSSVAGLDTSFNLSRTTNAADWAATGASFVWEGSYGDNSMANSDHTLWFALFDGRVASSTDGGITWSLLNGGSAVVAYDTVGDSDNQIVYGNGVLLLYNANTVDGGSTEFTKRSTDGGATWSDIAHLSGFCRTILFVGETPYPKLSSVFVPWWKNYRITSER